MATTHVAMLITDARVSWNMVWVSICTMGSKTTGFHDHQYLYTRLLYETIPDVDQKVITVLTVRWNTLNDK